MNLLSHRRTWIFQWLFLLGILGQGAVLVGASWEPLFDGRTLEGWEIRGGTAKYHVEDGMIVGTTVEGSPNTFLCTKKWYGDFILEFEVKADPALNSGVQIRSHTYREDTSSAIWRNGKKTERKHEKGEVYGYQVEIAHADTGTSGGVWDEARKSLWLANTTDDPSASKAFKNNQWNTYRIQCIGDSIKTWVNNIPCADFRDATDLIGFIGLQVHSVPKNVKAQVRWRNLRIQVLGRHVWKPIFDGKTLEGWHALPGGTWEVRDGIIHGISPASEKRHGLLVSDRSFGDFTARVKYKAIKGNSGFYFRSEKVDHAVGVNGFQAEIDASKDIGGLYETGGRAWVVQPTPEQVETWFRPQEWNTMTVSAHDRRIVVHVNERQTVELNNDPGRLEGHLALQLHGNMEMDVRFKDVEILVPAKNGGIHRPFNGRDLNNWTTKKGNGKNLWAVGVARMSPENPKLLVAQPGSGAMVNRTTNHGESLDIFSQDKFGDCRLEVEVMVPKGANSGIYVMGEYEIQVLDSHGKTVMNSGDMGAIYGAAPPPLNACKPAGEWQKYVVDFLAPKFNEEGKKIANAQFVRVELNGETLHRDLIMPSQTPGGVTGREHPTGPLMFQGNHGPVAYRNITFYDWSN